jgi:hypothetical protein
MLVISIDDAGDSRREGRHSNPEWTSELELRMTKAGGLSRWDLQSAQSPTAGRLQAGALTILSGQAKLPVEEETQWRQAKA